MKGIRLTDFEVLSISKAFRRHFKANDHIWLFGSRADLEKRGGDIDLYIETTIKDASHLNNIKLQFLAELENVLGEQKIDVIVNSNEIDLPIYLIAKTEGIKLL